MMNLAAAATAERPDPSQFDDCPRCSGTGWWALGRVCFRCGGYGFFERSTLATEIRAKRAHLAEVQEILAWEMTHLPPWGLKLHATRMAANMANLYKIEAELAALLAQVKS